jgi:hypothetical protein
LLSGPVFWTAGVVEFRSVTMRSSLGLAASVLIVGAVIVACRPTGDTGYVEIKTVPGTAVTPTALYLDAEKLAPIKKGSAVLRQPVGTIKLQAEGIGGARAALCDIVVRKNRITTVTISVLERPPRCQCRYGGADPASRTCLS